MSIQLPAPPPNTRRKRQNRIQQWETVGHPSDEAFLRVVGPLADLCAGMIRRGLEEGRVEEIDTPEGRMLVPSSRTDSDQVEEGGDGIAATTVAGGTAAAKAGPDPLGAAGPVRAATAGDLRGHPQIPATAGVSAGSA